MIQQNRSLQIMQLEHKKININLDLSFSYIIVEMSTLFPLGEEFLLLMKYKSP